MALKAAIAVRGEAVDDELVQALKGFDEHVEREMRDLSVRERKARAALERYEKARGMKEVAERLRTTQVEIEGVEGDLARLEVR